MKLKIGFILCLVAGAIFIGYGLQLFTNSQTSTEETQESSTQVGDNKNNHREQKSPRKTIDAVSLPKKSLLTQTKQLEEKVSLFINNTLLKNSSNPTSDEVHKMARDLEIQFKEEVDSNLDTGTVMFLKSSNANEQVSLMSSQFEGDQTNLDMTHLSIVLNPGPTQDKLLKNVVKNLNPKNMKVLKSGKLKVWPLGNGYVFWVQELDKSAIESDPLLADAGVRPNSLRFGRDLEVH